MRIYLAGPEVFHPLAQPIGEQKKALCLKWGFTGLFPLDNELQASPAPDLRKTALAISLANEQMIQSSDALIANLTPFRGPSADIGTAYEVGFARALGKIIVGYSYSLSPYLQRVTRKSEGLIDDSGLAIEDFDLFDNLMLAGALSTPIFQHPGTGRPEDWLDLSPFEACLQWLSSQH